MAATAFVFDDRTKYTVYGWIRETEKELEMEFIYSIISICIAYFGQIETWSIWGKVMKCSDDKSADIYGHYQIQFVYGKLK